VYEGKTTKCHLSIELPKEWHVTHTPNHWCNEETMTEYIKSVIVPYMDDARMRLGLSPTHTAWASYFRPFQGPDNSEDLKLIGRVPSYVCISACQLY